MWPGPPGWRRCRPAAPWSSPRPTDAWGSPTGCWPRRAPRLPCLSDRGPGGRRYLVTGRPVAAAICSRDRDEARRRFGIDADQRCLLVFGGSQGARSINLCALDTFLGDGPAARRDYHVIQIAGHRDYPLARERLRCRRAAGRLHAARVRAGSRRHAGGVRPGPRPRRGLGVRAGRGRKARDPRPLSARRRAPSARQRGLDGRVRCGARDRGLRARAPSPRAQPSRGCSPTPAASTRWRRPPAGSPARMPRGAIADEILRAARA